MTNIELASHLELFAGDVGYSEYSEGYGDILREAAIRLRCFVDKEDPSWNGDIGYYRGFDIVKTPYNDTCLLSISKGPVMYYVGWVNGEIVDATSKAIEWIDIECDK